MKHIFVDTAGWMACGDAADPAHALASLARDTALEAGIVLVTTDYVVDETLTLLRMHINLAAAKAWWAQVNNSTRLRWEWIGASRSEKARALFFRYRDKNFSFTDCTSFVVMQELRIKQALTTDHHFTQMGFDPLPSPAKRR